MQLGNQVGNASYWERRRFMGDWGPPPLRTASETHTCTTHGAGDGSIDAAVDKSVTDESSRPLQVYIVEDSPITRQFLASAIQSAGASLSGSSAEAPAAVGDVFALQPDLILIDISLASGSGFDVLKMLQDHGLAPAAIKVVLTNYTDAEYRNRSVSLGADRFFDKSSEIPQALALIDIVAAEGSRGSPLL